MERLTAIADLREHLGEMRSDGASVGLTPTMGALHEGHLAHVRRLRDLVDTVVVSIFVNPTQFGPDEDFEAYPRDLDRDEEALAGLADVVWAPAVDEMYPGGPTDTTVTVGGITEILEGAHRPGHFDGVTTVVTKLLNQVQPDLVTFGRKDYQQLAIVRRMLTDLDVPIRIVEIPIVREDDGVAMSSRNRYLDVDQRRAARSLSRALRRSVLMAREARAKDQRPSAELLEQVAGGTLDEEPIVRVDYLAVVDPVTLRAPRPVPGDRDTGGRDGASDQLLVAVAAHVGPARLIDNVVIGDEQDEERLLTATTD